MRSKVLARAGVLITTVILGVGATAAPASAHTISGPRPTNYRARVALSPAVPGISVRVVDLGSRVELTNRTLTDVTVSGYDGEPYLRIGPSGVYENIHSAATYLNRTRNGGTIPPNVDTSKSIAPEWKKISGAHSASWHDHRAHWMGGQPPPVVVQHPDAFHQIWEQDIVLHHDGARLVATVELDWVPGPSGWPWVPALVLMFAAGVAAAVLPRGFRVLAALLALLVVADVAHAIAYEIPRSGTSLAKVGQFAGGSLVSIVVWIAAIPTIIGVVRRRVEALYGVVFVSVMVALVGGATDLSALWKSQLPNAGPAGLARGEVVVALGLGVGLGVGAVVRMVRTDRERVRDDLGGRWLSLLVVGLSDAEVARVARDLDADEVLDVALRELAVRLQPAVSGFADGALVLDVVVEAAGGSHDQVWSLERVAPGVRAVRGRVGVVAAEMRVAFPVLLQLLAGTVTLADAVASDRATCTGARALIDGTAPYFAERADPVVSPASSDGGAAS